MVSTRQMTIGNNGSGDGGSAGNHQQSDQGVSSKFSRTASSSSCKALQTVQSIQLLDLPQEVIEKIFGYLPFKNVCQLRLVNHHVNEICSQILNSTFQRLQNKMLQRFQDIKKQMPRRESARRSHVLAGISDIVETLHMRLTLLQMTFGKHIERKHCCFFPGEILDEVYHILHYIEVTPKLDLPYKVTDELFDLSTMAMEYFKEKIEPNLPEIAYLSADFLKFSGSFQSRRSSKYLPLNSNMASEAVKDTDASHDALDSDDLVETIPQSNMVLRKRIRKIKQGMKRYNSQLSLLTQELRTCKRKTADQQKQIAEQQKQLTDQKEQTLEYAARLDEVDKKNEELSRKFSTILQELNKCKTELQYYRCKSPAIPPPCPRCGTTSQSEELQQILLNQDVNPEEPNESEFDSALVENHKVLDEPVTSCSNSSNSNSNADVILSPNSSPSTKNNIKRKLEDTTTCQEEGTSKKIRRYSRIRSKRVKV